MKLYHGTSATEAREIQQHGLKPRAMSGDTRRASAPDLVYLSEFWAPYFSVRNSLESGIVADDMALCELDFESLQETRLRPDEDFLAGIDLASCAPHLSRAAQLAAMTNAVRGVNPGRYQAQLEDKAHLWGQSLRQFGNCAYKGHIPADALRVVTFDRAALQIGGFYSNDTLSDCQPTAPVACIMARDFLDCIMERSAATGKSHLSKTDLRKAFSIPLPRLWVVAWKRFKSGGLGINSIHGPNHWLDVQRHARRLASQVQGADETVCRVFAIVHDVGRMNEGSDPQHGPRAAKWLDSLRRGLLTSLSCAQFEKLREAVATHADGATSSDPTIAACYDADRLDLPRVGITPNPSLLSTQAARDFQATRGARRYRMAELHGVSPLRFYITV